MTKRDVCAILFVFSAAILSLESCKKGENDPALSFKSRSARLKGAWKLNEKDAIISNATSENQISLSSITVQGIYTGEDESVSVNNSGNTTTFINKYFFDIDFEENGSYQYNLNILTPDPATPNAFINMIYNSSGVWSWLDQGKDKYGISLSNDFEPTIPDSLNPMTLLPYKITGAYEVDRLTSTELILKRKGNFTSSQNLTVTTTTFDGTFTFKR